MKNKINIKVVNSINKFEAKDWDNCNKNGNVFLSYNFLKLLEDSNSIGGNTGWKPIYFCLKVDDKITAVVPSFIKYHSQGEFVFDHSWAQAYQSLGLNYYPKLLIASPFSPVTGKRILVTPNANDPIKKKLFNFIKDFCKEKEISSIHINFFEEHELDFLKNEGIRVLGPDKFSSQLEGSKAFMKKLCWKYKIPTAAFKICNNIKQVNEFLKRNKLPIVVKADGLAAGKGVTICNSKNQVRNISNEYDLILVDDLSKGSLRFIPKKYRKKLIKKKIQNLHKVNIKKLKGIFHLAAQSSVPFSLQNFITLS